jgi:hypothetical protein
MTYDSGRCTFRFQSRDNPRIVFIRPGDGDAVILVKVSCITSSVWP